jgi:hypothetical protein
MWCVAEWRKWWASSPIFFFFLTSVTFFINRLRKNPHRQICLLLILSFFAVPSTAGLSETPLIRASPPPISANTPFHSILQQDSVKILLRCAPVLMVHFAVVILTPFKAFFFCSMDLDTDYYSSRCQDINGLSVFKGILMTFCGWASVIIQRYCILK